MGLVCICKNFSHCSFTGQKCWWTCTVRNKGRSPSWNPAFFFLLSNRKKPCLQGLFSCSFTPFLFSSHRPLDAAGQVPQEIPLSDSQPFVAILPQWHCLWFWAWSRVQRYLGASHCIPTSARSSDILYIAPHWFSHHCCFTWDSRPLHGSRNFGTGSLIRSSIRLRPCKWCIPGSKTGCKHDSLGLADRCPNK